MHLAPPLLQSSHSLPCALPSAGRISCRASKSAQPHACPAAPGACQPRTSSSSPAGLRLRNTSPHTLGPRCATAEPRQQILCLLQGVLAGRQITCSAVAPGHQPPELEGPEHSSDITYSGRCRECLKDTLSLLAYDQPEESPHGALMSEGATAELADAVDEALLQHSGQPQHSSLEHLLRTLVSQLGSGPTVWFQSPSLACHLLETPICRRRCMPEKVRQGMPW